KPLDAASLKRFDAVGGGAAAYPVLRLSATTPGRGSAVLSPTVLGVPAGALARMYWRSDFSPVPLRALARQLTRAGELRPAAVPSATLVLGPLRAHSRGRSLLLTDWRGWRLPTGGSVVRADGRVRLGVAFQNTGAGLVFRPKEPTDGRLMPVVTSRDVAAAA